MSDFDNTNTGALFKNDKQGNEKRPDYKGSLNVNGEEFTIAAWLKTSKQGQKYMSLKVEAKDEQRQAPPRQDAHNQAKANAYQPQEDDEDSEIPF